MSKKTDAIKISLTRTNFLTRWHCHVCGGRTEKDPILAEGRQDVGEHQYRTVRVCDQCLKAADGLSIDQRLDLFARVLDDEAALTRALTGKLVVPTHAEWAAANRKHNEELCREHESFSATTAPSEDDNTQSIPF